MNKNASAFNKFNRNLTTNFLVKTEKGVLYGRPLEFNFIAC